MNKITFLVMITMVIGFALIACGPKVEPTPTIDPNAIMTQVAGTIQAEATQNALLTPSPTATLPPTATPPPLPTLALTPGSAVSSPAGTGFSPTLPPESPDKALLIEESIPDGTLYWKGSSFTKTWKLENTGTTTWTTEYMFIYKGGELMSDITVINLQQPVKPGEQVTFNVPMRAPDKFGEFTSYWQMYYNNYFFGDVVWAKIQVVTSAEITSTPAG
jgi:hypothetical protein